MAAPRNYRDPACHLAELGWLRRQWQPLPPWAEGGAQLLGCKLRLDGSGRGLLASEDSAPGEERALAIARLGALHWVRLDGQRSALESDLPLVTQRLASDALSERHALASFFSLAHPCNWKIPVENVLESYHVPSLHRNPLAKSPRLFRVFGASAETVRHELGIGYSSYHDTFGAQSRLYRAMLRALEADSSGAYVHHHLHPNIILATTGIFSLVQQVLPVAPDRSLSNVWLFLRVRDTPLARLPGATRLLSALATAAIRKILDEDAAIYPLVQAGMASSRQRGVLGTREDRLWHFQRELLRNGIGPDGDGAAIGDPLEVVDDDARIERMIASVPDRKS